MTYFFYYGRSGYCLVLFVCIRRGFAHDFVNYKKKGAPDSQPQVIKFTSCLLMVGGSLGVLRLLPPLKLVAKIYLFGAASSLQVHLVRNLKF